MDNMDIEEDEISNNYNVNDSDDENNNEYISNIKKTKKFKKILKKPTEDLDYFMGYKFIITIHIIFHPLLIIKKLINQLLIIIKNIILGLKQ